METTVRSKYIGTLGVVMCCVVGLAVAALYRIEKISVEATAHAHRKLIAEQLAPIFERPLWSIDYPYVELMAHTVMRDPIFLCIVIQDEANFTKTFGTCGSSAAYERFAIPVIAGVPPRRFATVTADLDAAVDAAPVASLTGWRITVLAGSVAVTLAAAAAAFQALVGRPLQQVHASLRRFRETGERQSIQWSSRDDLGTFIDDYNAMLQLTQEKERALNAARSRSELALEDLKRAQAHLVQTEKLASLGSLVAGIAHEINTPIGAGVSVASTLSERVRVFRAVLDAGAMRKSTLQDFVGTVDEATGLLNRSLTTAHQLIQSFKRVAADQTSEARRSFDLALMLDEVLVTLRPQLKRADCAVDMQVPPGIVLDSYPGPLGQVITNLVTNAQIHAFDGQTGGHITISAIPEPTCVVLMVGDDGRGIEPDQLPRIFDPFYTTKLGAGGTGLGLSIVHSIVVKTLQGRIAVVSVPGRGTAFTMTLPVAIDETQPEETARVA
ncbi:MAG: ATP-binding protein [Azospirillaceae bacterium]|nr:ATP-binding protein [Azospirillaceae bacterium]